MRFPFVFTAALLSFSFLPPIVGQVITSHTTIPLNATVPVTTGSTSDLVKLSGSLHLTSQIPGNPVIPGNPIMPSRVISTLVDVSGAGLTSGLSYQATGTSIFEIPAPPPIAPSGITFSAGFRLQPAPPPIIPGNPVAPQIALSLPISLSLDSTGKIAQAAVQSTGILWQGNDCNPGGPATATDTQGNVLANVAAAMTGVAFDGSRLYFSDCFGSFSTRSSDGNSVLASFFVGNGPITEDMAWDSKRRRVWRVRHSPPTLERIDPSTGTIDGGFALPADDAVIFPRGPLGVAYNAASDQLYVSFCQAGCATLSAGVVSAYDAETGASLGDLFRTTGFAAAGLAYDPVTKTLWAGSGDDSGPGSYLIRNMTLTGATLSSFPRPYGLFADGLEFIGASVIP